MIVDRDPPFCGSSALYDARKTSLPQGLVDVLSEIELRRVKLPSFGASQYTRGFTTRTVSDTLGVIIRPSLQSLQVVVVDGQVVNLQSDTAVIISIDDPRP
ncbi:hypothetical protein BDV98DRAFT_75497 [Pterulicium gracile]|uniref:Uncharacterized protein n=1 Tax=Pterulicium gracile TaxID=1884261 RepID=A0A5C3QSC6_9AGAR|nr:hypothetical protein BDV98DRAFT_75497 [Pterula gracilis]